MCLKVNLEIRPNLKNKTEAMKYARESFMLDQIFGVWHGNSGNILWNRTGSIDIYCKILTELQT